MMMVLSSKIGDRLKVSSQRLIEVFQEWAIVEVALFGSVLRDDFHEDSDIDFLITFAPEANQGLLTLARIKYQLEALLNRTVDLIPKESIEEGENWIRCQEIVNTAVTIYEA